MSWLKNWDDLTHGTAVFGAAIPFLLVFGLAFVIPPRNWWKLCALALLPVAYWLFHFPRIPPIGSDDVVFVSLLVSVAILYLETVTSQFPFKTPLCLFLRTILFATLGWFIYPAWLAADADTGKKILIVAAFALSISLGSLFSEFAISQLKNNRIPLTAAAFVPPTIALAILLQTGGSMRFAQVAGALAAGLAALCLALLLRKSSAEEIALHQKKTAALWAIMVVMLGWSGWLFAEIRYVLAALLVLAPITAAIVTKLSALPRKSPFQAMLWDTLASALVAAPIAIYAAIQYASEMAEFEGY